MGGDEGPAVVVPGAAIALDRHPDVNFLLFGDQTRISPYLEQHPPLAERSRIVHTDSVVEMQDKPSQAVRRGRSSSMWLALDAVHKHGLVKGSLKAGWRLLRCNPWSHGGVDHA